MNPTRQRANLRATQRSLSVQADLSPYGPGKRIPSTTGAVAVGGGASGLAAARVAVVLLASLLFSQTLTSPALRRHAVRLHDAGRGVRAATRGRRGSRLVPGSSRDQRRSTRRPLLCLPRERLMLVASRSYSEIHAFDDRETLRWTQSIPGYRGITYRGTAPGRFEYIYPPDDLWDSVASLFEATKGVVAVCAPVRRHDPPRPGRTYPRVRVNAPAAPPKGRHPRVSFLSLMICHCGVVCPHASRPRTHIAPDRMQSPH